MNNIINGLQKEFENCSINNEDFSEIKKCWILIFVKAAFIQQPLLLQYIFVNIGCKKCLLKGFFINTLLTYICLSTVFVNIFLCFFLGSVILFTEILSMTFLGRPFKKARWFGILMILSGLAFVGFADFIIANEESSGGTEIDINAVITGEFFY